MQKMLAVGSLSSEEFTSIYFRFCLSQVRPIAAHVQFSVMNGFKAVICLYELFCTCNTLQHEQDIHGSEHCFPSPYLQQNPYCTGSFPNLHQYKPFFLTAYRFPREEERKMSKCTVMS